MKKRMRSKAIRLLLLMVILLTMICSSSLWMSYHYLTITRFQVSSKKISAPIRIVLVSDLHDHIFRENNERLIKKIEAQNPDMIVLDGDMINGDSADCHVATDLISGLIGTSPVYYALGNHELAYMENGHPELVEELEAAGAVVLDHKIIDLEMKGSKLQLGSLYEYAFDTPMQDEQANESALSYMEQYVSAANSNEYTLICAHRPESLYCFDYADKLWGLDLVLSGHLHGGQVIIPFIGGLYSSMESFFPRFDYGQFEIGNCTMIITRGLSTNKKALPRFNNPPEIVVVDLSPEEN